MKTGDPIQCPHCGADSFLKKESVMDGWTKVGEVLKCASCSAVIADCTQGNAARESSDAADRFKKFLGAEGLESMTRIMGLIMVCIGVQFIATGIGEFITNPKQIYPSANAVEMKEVILQNSSEAESQSIQQNDK